MISQADGDPGVWAMTRLWRDGRLAKCCQPAPSHMALDQCDSSPLSLLREITKFYASRELHNVKDHLGIIQSVFSRTCSTRCNRARTTLQLVQGGLTVLHPRPSFSGCGFSTRRQSGLSLLLRQVKASRLSGFPEQRSTSWHLLWELGRVKWPYAQAGILLAPTPP